jgi:hypothetical protein
LVNSSSSNVGIGADGNHIGHGGAYGTNSAFEKKTGLITIFLVQQAGWSNGGEKIAGTLEKAARDTFALKWLSLRQDAGEVADGAGTRPRQGCRVVLATSAG